MGGSQGHTQSINQSHLQAMIYGWKYARRYDFLVVFEASKKISKKVLHKSAQKFFARMKEIHLKFIIRPWKDEVDKKVLSKKDLIPTMPCNLCFISIGPIQNPKVDQST